MLTANLHFRFWNPFKRTDRGVYARFPSKLFIDGIKIVLIAVYVRLWALSQSLCCSPLCLSFI
jgi:hypothetical protein